MQVETGRNIRGLVSYYITKKADDYEWGVLELGLHGGRFFEKNEIQISRLQKNLKKYMQVCKDVMYVCVKIHDEIPWIAACAKKTNSWPGRMNSSMC